MRALLLALLLVLGLAGPASAGDTVVVAVPGLSWDDVSEETTPVLWQLARIGTPGLLAARSQDEHSTPEEGMRTLLSGDRTEDATPRAVPNLVDLGPFGLSDLRAVDATISEYLGAETLIVVGSGDLPGGPPRLRVAIVRGPAYRGGVLTSASTGRPGYVQLIDVAPTVLGVQPGMTGQPMRRVDGSLSVAELRDATLAADAHRSRLPWFFAVFGVVQLGFYLVARGRVRRAGALGFLGAPAAMYLAQLTGWWRHDLWYVLLVVAAISAAIGFAASRVPGRFGPPGAVAGFTALLLAADLALGAPLQMSSLAGYSPIVAGRFAGLGNVAFAVFGTAALLATAALCAGRSRRFAAVAVAVAGIAAVVVDGHPSLGADFGGVVALVPAFALLGALLTGVRVTVARVAAVGTLLALAAGLFLALDYARPPDARTHLGRFAERVMDGEAGEIVARKAEANLGLVTHSPLTLLAPVAIAALAYAVLRPRGALAEAFEREPALRAGLLAVLALALLGFAANDSGLGVPTFATTLAVPTCVRMASRD